MAEPHIVDIPSLVAFTDQIGTASQYLVQDFQGQLYHYTDLEALRNILQNHDLWLTNCRYSNDEHEITHGYEIAKTVIAREKRRRGRSGQWKDYVALVAELVEEMPAEGVYICCFCTQDNLLSQWRGYGENGTGVSIAFDPTGFHRFSGPDLPPTTGLMRLWKVFYENRAKERIVLEALNLIPDLDSGDSVNVRAQKAADAIHFFMPTFKDSDFREEEERRLIFRFSGVRSELM